MHGSAVRHSVTYIIVPVALYARRQLIWSATGIRTPDQGTIIPVAFINPMDAYKKKWERDMTMCCVIVC